MPEWVCPDVLIHSTPFPVDAKTWPEVPVPPPACNVPPNVSLLGTEKLSSAVDQLATYRHHL